MPNFENNHKTVNAMDFDLEDLVNVEQTYAIITSR